MTERSFADEARAEALLSELRSTGAAVSVDDFGLGFADLSYVAKLDLDYVRLGPTIVRSIGASEEKAAMVGQFITFARSIGAQVIANGVENADQERYLRSCGVALAEGPYYGAELGIEDAARELSGQSIARQTRARLGA
jgi:two-component system CheB/CheR fusion protein